MQQFEKSVFGPLCLSLLLLHSAASAQISFTTSSIARPGEPAPVPAQLVQVSSPSVNDSGQMAYLGDGAVLLQSQGATRTIAAVGDPAPGGGMFIGTRMPSINAQGQVAFVGTVARPGRSGIFLWSEGVIHPLVQVGDSAPGGGQFSSFFEISLKRNGEGVVMPFNAYTSLRQEGLFLFSGNAVQLLARSGDPAPRGGRFVNFYFPVVNGVGQVAFHSFLEPTSLGVFLYQPDGTITEVARAGDPAPEGGRFVFPTAAWPAPQDFTVTGDFASSHNPRWPASPARPRLGPQKGTSREPLTDGAATFNYFGGIASINDSSELAFSASTSMLGRGGIFVFSNGQITRRVRELDPAPGGGLFRSLYFPSLNEAGQIAFQGYASGDSSSGVFLFSPDGSVGRIARQGQPSPEGDTFTYASAPSLNNAGQVAFNGQLLDSLGGVYLSSAGEIARVAGQGDPIDREPRFINSPPQGIDATGTVLFTSTTFPGGTGLFVGAPVIAIARLGDPAPGGGVFNSLESSLATMNASGTVVFAAATTFNNTYGLYSFSNGALSRVAASGDPAPGGGTFSFFSAPAIDDAGDIVLLCNASPPSNSGIYLLSSGEWRNLAAVGGPAPGGGTFSSFAFPTVNNLLQASFLGFVTAPGRTGIFHFMDGIVEAIAQTGDPAPGPGGWTFDFPADARYLYAPSMNAIGEVAFGAPLSRFHDVSGVFKFFKGVLTTVAGPGEPAPGGETFGYADTASLNDAGQVAFYAFTQNTEGIFLLSEGTPSAIALDGDPAPGGGTLSYVDVPRLSLQTQVGFLGVQPDGNGVFLATPTR